MPVFTSSIEVTADYPTIKPSLNLNFARARALDPRITFTRASVGTYVGRDGLIKTAGDNEARFDHDPVTLESLGLLIEESRTNQFPYSSNFSTWATNNVSFVTGISDPEGGTNATKMVVTSTNNGAGLAAFTTNDTTLTNGTTYTQSLWAKKNAFPVSNNAYFVIQIATSTGFTQGYRNFDLSTGTLGDGDVSGSIVEYPDGWYRVSVTAQATTSGSGRMAIAIVDSPTSSRIGDCTIGSQGQDGVYVWGAQLEASSFATSYIPTSGSAVTRQDDFGSITGESFNNFFNPSEGTFDVGYKIGEDNTSMRVSQVSNGSGNTAIDLVVASGGGVGGYWFINTGGVSQFSAAGVTNSSQVDRNFRAVLAYKENDCAAQSNKITAGPTTDTSVTLATDYDRLLFYQVANNGDHIQGHLKFIRYYPKRLTNAQVTLFSQN